MRWIEWDYTSGEECPIPDALGGQYAIKNQDGRIEYPKCPAVRAGWHGHKGLGADRVNIVAYALIEPKP